MPPSDYFLYVFIKRRPGTFPTAKPQRRNPTRVETFELIDPQTPSSRKHETNTRLGNAEPRVRGAVQCQSDEALSTVDVDADRRRASNPDRLLLADAATILLPLLSLIKVKRHECIASKQSCPITVDQVKAARVAARGGSRQVTWAKFPEIVSNTVLV